MKEIINKTTIYNDIKELAEIDEGIVYKVASEIIYTFAWFTWPQLRNELLKKFGDRENDNNK